MTKLIIIVGAILALIILVVIGVVLWGTGIYNSCVSGEEKVTSSWSQVENVYQRRMELIPNLVETVKGFAKQEKDVFLGVTEARSKVNNINLSSDIIDDPAKFQQFQNAQGEMSSALSRLMVVVENYPELKSNENFLNLQSQLEGSENRIAVERKRYNEVAMEYNTFIRKVPNSLIAGYYDFKPKEYFKMQEGADTAPKVEFDK